MPILKLRRHVSGSFQNVVDVLWGTGGACNFQQLSQRPWKENCEDMLVSSSGRPPVSMAGSFGAWFALRGVLRGNLSFAYQYHGSLPQQLSSVPFVYRLELTDVA